MHKWTGEICLKGKEKESKEKSVKEKKEFKERKIIKKK